MEESERLPMSMDLSAISGGAPGDTLQAAVQTSLLQTAQDMQAQQMNMVIQTIQSVSPPHLGANFDKTA